MEQIRIVKEMRNATNGTRPRFMVWENVPGAFSSNKGGDFAAVLEETIRVVEPEAPVLMCLNADGRHGDSTATWEDDGAWRGECSTRNTGESPNVVVASRLSQILEEAPQEKREGNPEKRYFVLDSRLETANVREASVTAKNARRRSTQNAAETNPQSHTVLILLRQTA